jgi:hypothetical protein
MGLSNVKILTEMIFDKNDYFALAALFCSYKISHGCLKLSCFITTKSVLYPLASGYLIILRAVDCPYFELSFFKFTQKFHRLVFREVFLSFYFRIGNPIWNSLFSSRIRLFCFSCCKKVFIIFYLKIKNYL